MHVTHCIDTKHAATSRRVIPSFVWKIYTGRIIKHGPLTSRLLPAFAVDNGRSTPSRSEPLCAGHLTSTHTCYTHTHTFKILLSLAYGDNSPNRAIALFLLLPLFLLVAL
eukprot:Gregarina_sp_Pseudo_9__3625@NODE_3783_length_559_cov_16_496154_g3464_i0_p1_GENE_NODE_3783_length_559_cov_16_496154_g3464_i0NODE_3783_length_559_cov_16_496154_g3464_i0_p1_ORF_typecomplete_len110_score2_35_NODE_3783_length_559_cov_16_496154_g3464_i072401